MEFKDGAQIGQETDQLKIIIDQLKRKPESRRCVLSIWNVEDDLLKIDTTKDACCNTHAYFSIRTKDTTTEANKVYRTHIPVLDMTVCNRSNDLIWGLLGANTVHFGFLLEYMAACIGVEVGVQTHFTNNLHVYTERYKPNEWLVDLEPNHYAHPRTAPLRFVSLVYDPETFDREVVEFIDNADWTRNWEEPFLQTVASPMCWAFELHKKRSYSEALKAIALVASDDWRLAGTQWIERRRAGWEAKQRG
jgi:hypothetical protein